MELEQSTQVEQPVSPAPEVVSGSQPAETITPEAPAASTEDTELAAAQAAIEQAKTPEEKERARDGYQRRKEAKEFRETQQRVKDLELKLAREQGAREIYERIGAQPQQAPPQQVQEPVIPAPQMPPRPDASQWTDAEGYEDIDKKTEAIADWRAKCAVIEYQHGQTVERIKADTQRNAKEIHLLVTDINQKYPGFTDKLFRFPVSESVGGSIGSLAAIDRPLAIETANYLVNNPAEMQRLSNMHPDAAKIEFGRIAAKLSLPPVQSKKVSEAPEPAKAVVSTETTETFDPNKADMPTYGRHHPACPPWLK